MATTKQTKQTRQQALDELHELGFARHEWHYGVWYTQTFFGIEHVSEQTRQRAAAIAEEQGWHYFETSPAERDCVNCTVNCTVGA
jgi:hypothetical protein